MPYAYINHGRWLVDCPCNGAENVRPGQDLAGCQSCFQTIAPVEWPPDPDALMGQLAARDEAHRNWAPAGHRQTYVSAMPDGQLIADVFPQGQTVADLRSENRG